MPVMSEFKFSHVDFFLTCVGLLFLLLDIMLDVVAAVDFFKDKEYARLGLLLVFLVGSSLLVQAFSWLWYCYDNFDRGMRAEGVVGQRGLLVLHLLQLGTYFRHAGVMEMAIQKLLCSRGRGRDPGDMAVYLSHDVAMLRIVETFSESLPQLVLMVTTNIQKGHLDTIPVLKSVGSALTISFCVTSYHRSLRGFLKEKNQQTVVSSVVYFLWNLLLIAARVTALSLFASEFPCFILTHFLCSWTLLVFCAWCAQTNFMNGHACDEWLYRATVGLIWYFNWFNVVEGRTFLRSLLYHGYILGDITLLCGLWFWKMNPDIHNFNYKHLNVFLCIVFFYLFGLLGKAVYFHYFHPNVIKKDLKGIADEPDSVRFRSAPIEKTRINKRMMNLANNFYS